LIPLTQLAVHKHNITNGNSQAATNNNTPTNMGVVMLLGLCARRAQQTKHAKRSCSLHAGSVGNSQHTTQTLLQVLPLAYAPDADD
jgi:hypothetical protein